jgi:hypothetical protein
MRKEFISQVQPFVRNKNQGVDDEFMRKIMDIDSVKRKLDRHQGER